MVIKCADAFESPLWHRGRMTMKVWNGEQGRSAPVLRNSTLDPFLRKNGINTLFFMGFATHVCVESSLRDAHDLGYNAYMVEDACAAFEAIQHEHVRRHVVHHFGEEISSMECIAIMEQ